MDGLLHFGLTNVAWAAVLALVAAVGSRIFRRYPAVVHSLWLMVLLKLVTPSVVRIPVGWSESLPREIVGKSESIERRPSVVRLSDVSRVPRERPNDLAGSLRIDPTGEKRAVPMVTATTSWHWRQGIGVLWLAGMAVWWVVIGLSITRFRRLLRLSCPASPTLEDRLAQIGARLGLERVPGISIVAARVPPMLWSGFAGHPRIVLPEELWSRFDLAQQDAVLAHELAHLK